MAISQPMRDHALMDKSTVPTSFDHSRIPDMPASVFVAILNRRQLPTGGRRVNRWVKSLRAHIEERQGPWTKVDRLLFGAIVEARSCERFTRLLEVLQESDPEVARLLADLGPAEKRHWQLFFRLAGREVAAEALAERFRGWLELDRDLALAAGIAPTVHG